jgi:hypothetical protein
MIVSSHAKANGSLQSPVTIIQPRSHRTSSQAIVINDEVKFEYEANDSEYMLFISSFLIAKLDRFHVNSVRKFFHHQ